MRSLRVVLRSVALTAVVFAAPAPLSAEPDARAATPAAVAHGVPRVRPIDGRMAALVLEGITRSERLRELISLIEQSDVIVYIETQPLLRGRVAGSLTWLTRTEHFRYVRISISFEQFGEMAIALLAHELQHALEVADHPSVVDLASLEALYRRIGRNVGLHARGWDTEAARDAGEDVRRELALSRTVRVAESIQPFDPLDWHVVYRRARERAK